MTGHGQLAQNLCVRRSCQRRENGQGARTPPTWGSTKPAWARRPLALSWGRPSSLGDRVRWLVLRRGSGGHLAVRCRRARVAVM